ncbi:hypothetical protein [Bradyrhizobium sp. 2TAF24]|uniref:hypothetical protein n=1 Tax=Bradyrhizobium sp. 2TAF24 TaxID=3233011 RepID=UPI003F8F3AB2
MRRLVPEKPKRSEAAESVGRWGSSGYRIGRLIASLCLIVASLHTLLSAEQIAHRLLSLIFIGALPALAAYLFGCLAYRVLCVVSEIYDPAARGLDRMRAVATRIMVTLRDVVVLPGMAMVRRWLAPLAARGVAGGAALLRRGYAAALPLRSLIHWAGRVVLRVATAPIRGLAGLMLRLQAPMPARRPT